MSPPGPPALAGWHRVVEARDPSLLADLLADDVVFHSPRWGVDDRLTSFTVLVRPLQGLQALIAQMARALAG